MTTTKQLKTLISILKKELAPKRLTKKDNFYFGRNHGINRAIYLVTEWEAGRKTEPSKFKR